ncbi:MAG: SMC-Scp complex subunit ScpB [Oscillospiraceae bacterium]|jgi:segregation and condensation protein B|nr:SMC-Scp complex subunit ScpB [Oscillospiraceae bacterium]
MEIKAAIEGILFASGDPVDVSRIAAVLGVTRGEAESAALELAHDMRQSGRGVRVVRIENALQMCSAPELADVIRTTLESGKPPKLSPQALEVLSVVAYFQPVTRAYIEQVRGVDASNTLRMLQTRGLVERCGHLNVVGRPSLYATTDAFLRTFALESLSELPPLAGSPVAPDGSADDQITIDGDFPV